jgi:hypothetical protein
MAIHCTSHPRAVLENEEFIPHNSIPTDAMKVKARFFIHRHLDFHRTLHESNGCGAAGKEEDRQRCNVILTLQMGDYAAYTCAWRGCEMHRELMSQDNFLQHKFELLVP